MKTIYLLILLGNIIFLTSCGPKDNSNRAESEVSKNEKSDVRLVETIQLNIGAANFRFSSFEVCPGPMYTGCDKVVLLDSPEKGFTYTHKWLWGSDTNFPFTVDSLREALKEKPVDATFNVNAEELFKDVKLLHYNSLSRCRAHPQWNQYLDLALAERPFLYLSLVTTKEFGHLALPIILKINLKTGAFEVIKKYGTFPSETFEETRFVAIANFKNNDGSLALDNQLLSFRLFSVLCAKGYHDEKQGIETFLPTVDAEVTRATFARYAPKEGWQEFTRPDASLDLIDDYDLENMIRRINKESPFEITSEESDKQYWSQFFKTK